jgi:hypothetical protein
MQNYGLTPSQTAGMGRTYQYFTGTPTYPFGYGLSYSTFTYSHVMADPHAVSADRKVNVHFKVTNTGTVPGATVAQVYAATPFSVPGVELPEKRLAGFQKTAVLQPGQTQSIAVPVKISDLALWDEQQHKNVVYDGPYQFQVATNSSDVVGSDTVDVTGATTARVTYVTVQPDQVEFTPGQTLDLTGKNPWIKDDTAQAAQHAPADGIVEAVNNDESFVDLAHAHVTYASSNPNVAAVSSSGMVQAIAAGTATISATVNGVAGSTPIVVKQPFTLSAPAIAPPGSALTATTTLPNPSSAPLSNVSMTLTAPAGWTVTPTTPASFDSVAPGQTVQTTWAITAPTGTNPASYGLSAQASFTSANGQGNSSDASTVSVPYPSLSAAFNNAGISDDSDIYAANFDGAGNSYSEQALTAAGLAPGTTIAHDGISFTWPDIPAGQLDNVVAEGQPILVSGSGNTLGFLGSSSPNNVGGAGTVYYSDGTTSDFTVTLDNWFNTPGPGNDIIATLPYINDTNPATNGGVAGKRNQTVYVFYAGVPITSGKTVKAVSLPTGGSIPASGRITGMHIFAIGVG